jgi:hypothetical protein
MQNRNLLTGRNSNISLTQILLKMLFFPLDSHESLIATIRYLWILLVSLVGGAATLIWNLGARSSQTS